MFTRTKPAALQNSTGETLSAFFAPKRWTRDLTSRVREFVDSDLTREQLRRWFTRLHDRKDLVRGVQELTPEDQARFIDKVDQVRRS